uniref:DUF1579 domain-containing protein n=1 Tax=Thermorudis peleae TaxID=1382356 RepID=A0A831TF14_9BACT
MLGEMIGEERGQITGMRVLPSEAGMPRIEASFQASGRLLDTEMTDMGTYWSVARPDGTFFGSGQGLIVTSDGEMINWTGHGVGRPSGHGMAVSWRGAIYYQTTAPEFARLNGVAIVFEYETDESGQTHARIWEWK